MTVTELTDTCHRFDVTEFDCYRIDLSPIWFVTDLTGTCWHIICATEAGLLCTIETHYCGIIIIICTMQVQKPTVSNTIIITKTTAKIYITN